MHFGKNLQVSVGWKKVHPSSLQIGHFLHLFFFSLLSSSCVSPTGISPPSILFKFKFSLFSLFSLFSCFDFVSFSSFFSFFILYLVSICSILNFLYYFTFLFLLNADIFKHLICKNRKVVFIMKTLKNGQTLTVYYEIAFYLETSLVFPSFPFLSFVSFQEYPFPLPFLVERETFHMDSYNLVGESYF